MSDTASTPQGQYMVVAENSTGQLGYRSVGSTGEKFCIRMEPSGCDASNKLQPSFPSMEWTQPDGKQMRYSRTVEGRPDFGEALKTALEAMCALDRSLVIKSEPPEWVQELVWQYSR